jgi:hypothetical protein
MLIAATACRFPEQSKRAALDAATSFVLRSVFDLQSRVPLTQNSARPALQATASAPPCALRKVIRHRLLVVANYADGRLVITRCRVL